MKRFDRILAIASLGLGLLLVLFFVPRVTQKESQPPEESHAATPQITSQGPSRFEPPDGKAYYGMGQELDYTSGVFNGKYTNETQPGICTVYSKNGIRPRLISGYMGVSRSNGMQEILGYINTINSKEGNYYVPVIGIAAFVSADGLLNGTYDANLRAYGAQVKAYGKPVFIRPVYEINEFGESGQKFIDKYGAVQGKANAIASYKRIVDKMREGAGGDIPNVAWIWHVIPQGLSNSYYDSWFPGNRYVDWVGISQFSAGYGPNQVTDLAPVSYAKSKGLPVIIPESAPVTKSVNGGAGTLGILDPNVISLFFNPYFSNIENSGNQIKGFVYTNNDYTGIFSGWLDNRMQLNQSVVDKFVTETKKSTFQVPVDALRVGSRPFEMEGITAGWQTSDGILHIISKDKYWELNQSNSWTRADLLQNVVPFNTAPSVNGLKPWEGGGVTAVWTQPTDTSKLLYVLSHDRFYTYSYEFNAWSGEYLPNAITYWRNAPLVNGLKPWQGGGITAAWVAPDNYLRIISTNRFYRYNVATGIWDNTPAALGVLPLGNSYWSSASLVDGQKPWEGAGITGGWVKDGHILQLRSKDKYWDWDLNIGTPGQNWIGSGNYRDLDNNNVWKKAPFIEIAGSPQPSTNQTAVCPLPVTNTPTPTRTGTPTPTFTKTPTPTFTKTPTPTATKSPTPTPTKSPTPSPTKSLTPTFTLTPTKSPTPTFTGTLTPTGNITVTNTKTPTPTNTSVPTNTGTIALIPGDANADGHVDGVDYTIWLFHYSQTTTSGFRDGDFNNDGKVDGVDFVVWLNHYGI